MLTKQFKEQIVKLKYIILGFTQPEAKFTQKLKKNKNKEAHKYPNSIFTIFTCKERSHATPREVVYNS